MAHESGASLKPRPTTPRSPRSPRSPETPKTPAAQLRAVAALVLLAGAAPARVVAPDVAVLVDDRLRRPHGGRLRRRRERRREATACGGDRVRALQLLVLVGERLRRGDGLELLLSLLALHLDVEQRQRNLLADHATELLEHHVPFAAVLDERILLRHRAQVDALAQVVHGLEVLPPARVDDLEDHVPLDLAHELRPERLLPLRVLVDRVADELLDEGV